MRSCCQNGPLMVKANILFNNGTLKAFICSACANSIFLIITHSQFCYYHFHFLDSAGFDVLLTAKKVETLVTKHEGITPLGPPIRSSRTYWKKRALAWTINCIHLAEPLCLRASRTRLKIRWSHTEKWPIEKHQMAPGGLERVTLNLPDQFSMAALARVSSAANLVSSLSDHSRRPLLLYDWLKWAAVSDQEVIASSVDSLWPCLPYEE